VNWGAPTSVADDPLRITDQGDFILVEYSGEFSVAACKACIDQMVAACEQFGRSRVLLDCRRIQGPLPTFDRFQVAVYGSSKRQQIERLALVRDPENSPPDNLVEDVSVNRGFNLKAFTDLAAATAWLRAES
jgi:hypothetical protein